MKSLSERFWVKVDKGDDCWIWTAGRDRKGYGMIRTKDRLAPGRHASAAHRVAWELTYGPIPPRMFVLHRCDNPPCVRPDHLWLGTNADNLRDASRKGRIVHGDGHWTRRTHHRPHIPSECMVRGERSAQAKLTEEAVRFILAASTSGVYRQQDLADQFSVSRRSISDVIRRVTWRHVT